MGSSQSDGPAAAAQAPPPGALNIDHVAHMVPDIDAASAALTRLGFTQTPFSEQSHRLQPGGPLVPAGSGNRCVMLESGYLEYLTPTGATPVADQLRAAIERYVGVHLIAFGTQRPDLDFDRLAKERFGPLAPIALQRPIGTESGEGLARFTVVRVPPGTMAEGRIQYCQQHTPELLWQPRWLKHENGATRLASVLLVVADPREAAQRYSRYTGLPSTQSDDAWRLETARGVLIFVDEHTVGRVLELRAPILPWIAGYALETRDIVATRDYLARARLDVQQLSTRRTLVAMPPALGGILVFQAAGAGPLQFS